MGKIILLNGPPSSGKDTAAKHIRDNYNFALRREGLAYNDRCSLDRMSMPIKRAFAGYMAAPIDADGAVQGYEDRKDQQLPELDGRSYRQWQIDFSEHFIKPLYGSEAFPLLLAARIRRRFERGIANLIVVPDCGFQVEVAVLYTKFNPADILLVRCHRPDFGFQQDSRSYVRAPIGCATFDPLNNFNVEQYLLQIEAGVRCWLETPERMEREA